MHAGMVQQLKRPTHVSGKFTNNCCGDCSDPLHERRGMKADPLEVIFLR
jgi:hypothetical protein